jgi:N-acyl-D-amino-acid deacylase
MLDVLLKGGTIVDGTGSAPRRGDVGIAGDRIVAIEEKIAGQSKQVIDCSGLVVAPGTIDIHTHYDAQVLWDAELTPSSSFGVTSVVMGNCGLSIAPLPASQREKWINTVSRVEAMSTQALKLGIRWEFESLAEYYAAIERFPLTLNVASYVGHNAIRMHVMGSDALRKARPEEITQMRRVLRESLEAGAIGFSTSKAAGHIDSDGNHEPTWFADVEEEMYALADEIGSIGKGVIQQQIGLGYSVPEIREMARRSGRKVTWTALHGGQINGIGLYAESVRAQREGLCVLPQIGVMPTMAQFTMEHPYLLKTAPAFAGLREEDLQAREKAYRDRAWRAQALQELTENREGRGFDFRWTHILVNESPTHPELVGQSIAQIVESDNKGRSPVDVLIDLALEDDLRTRIDVILYDEPIEDTFYLKSPATIIGSSDAGAHASQMCNAAYGPYLLSHWVRDRKELTLEFAIWRLTGQPAEFLGLADRGHLKPGHFADIWVFDPETIEAGPMERLYDLPGGGDRLIRHTKGTEHVLVNGGSIIAHGARVSGIRPGRILRS